MVNWEMYGRKRSRFICILAGKLARGAEDHKEPQSGQLASGTDSNREPFDFKSKDLTLYQPIHFKISCAVKTDIIAILVTGHFCLVGWYHFYPAVGSNTLQLHIQQR
jgi:hypothetical protein